MIKFRFDGLSHSRLALAQQWISVFTVAALESVASGVCQVILHGSIVPVAVVSLHYGSVGKQKYCVEIRCSQL